MADRVVARRYAEAFVNTLGESHRSDSGLEELKVIARIYADSKEFQRFLGSPEIAPEDKERLMNRLWSDDVAPQTRELLKLLIRRDRVEETPLIAEEALLVAESRQGVLRGQVTTARPISLAETEVLAKAVGSLIGKNLILDRLVDPALLGGVRIAVGTTLLDGSVQLQLTDIAQQLKSTKDSP